MTLGIVRDSPSRAAVMRRFGAQDAVAANALAANALDLLPEVGALEEQDCFVPRGIVFRALLFQTDERGAGFELGKARFVPRYGEAEDVLVKASRTV